MPEKSLLNNLLSRQDTWKGHQYHLSKNSISTGNDYIDKFLLGGWPLSAITEVSARQNGIGELSLLLPVLKHYTNKGKLCVWLDPPYEPYAPCLADAEILLDKILIVRSKNTKEWLWAAEQIIQGNALLFAWTHQINPNYTALRKLQLAATDNLSPTFLFREISSIKVPSPASLRIEIEGVRTNIMSLLIHKFKGKVPGTRIRINLSNKLLERTLLNKLPVNICPPKQYKGTFSLPATVKPQHLNA
jgi:hypothetical protein|tara:strand:+ start:2420 stop:3157 length:738 start_codon:yes stop_codon:yes gene_type:complete